jgi:hypothetical protein
MRSGVAADDRAWRPRIAMIPRSRPRLPIAVVHRPLITTTPAAADRVDPASSTHWSMRIRTTSGPIRHTDTLAVELASR